MVKDLKYNKSPCPAGTLLLHGMSLLLGQTDVQNFKCLHSETYCNLFHLLLSVLFVYSGISSSASHT